MGRFIYPGVGSSYTFDDRTLAHLELAISVKFRRNESFGFTLYGRELPAGEGAHTFWMASSIPLQFDYTNRSARELRNINPAWIEALIKSASSPDGLRLIDEP